MERAQRRLLIQYPKRQQGNRMFGGDTSFLPLKINTAGVIPPIFASSPAAAAGDGRCSFLATANLPTWAAVAARPWSASCSTASRCSWCSTAR